jgi:hypothetical protein
MTDEQHTQGEAWLLVTASSAGAADSLRVAIWRKLRSLGALYLQESQVVSELQAARDDEYGEVLERVPAFLDELRRERDRDRATYEEVEESEADLERFRVWLAKIDRRDYFGAPRRAEAHAAVERCAQALEAFESEAFARDAQPATDQPTLRAVPDKT